MVSFDTYSVMGTVKKLVEDPIEKITVIGIINYIITI